MTLTYRLPILLGTAAAVACLGALPAQAELTVVSFDLDALEELDAASLDFADEPTAEVPVEEAASLATEANPAEAEADLAEAAIATDLTADIPETEVPTLAETVEAESFGEATDLALPTDSVTTTAPLAFSEDGYEVAQIRTEEVEQLAQVTAPLFRGIAPAYLGIGGNIGLDRSADSAVGDFGFSVFGKVSLGPRFAVRPALLVSEQDVSVAIPVTFNFNPVQFNQFTVAPFIGGGVDVGDSTGLLINAGLDIPISQQFTLTAQSNFRVTNGTGIGLLLGVGYNIPLFFE
jgi:hypothetical protein